MGPNGTGKSTLAYAVMGHPKYEITEGDILIDGESILDMAPDERSRAGIFLAFQYPVSIPGVTVANFLRTALNARMRHADPPQDDISVLEFRKMLKSKMDLLEMEYSFGGRYLNEGFSGGEKKRTEVLQLAVLEPAFAILDETDSGLDIDAIRIVSEGVNAIKGPNMGVMVITHYQRILNYIKPDFVHIMFDGRIVESGSEELSLLLEEEGYDWIREKYGQSESA
jgi:Fe-S cluster assembly ATP-binding protein